MRWAESVNRKKFQGAVVIHGDFAENQLEGQTGFFDDDEEGFEIDQRHGSLILTNDNEDNRRLVEHCYKKRKTLVNPIIEWADEDVWEFIKAHKIPYCCLYDEGFHRLGCVGCPMGGTKGRLRDFERWPKYKHHYLFAFDKMLQLRRERHKQDPSRPVWKTKHGDTEEVTAEDVFNWWIYEN